MSNFMMSSDALIILWAVAAVLFVAYLLRRRKRKMF